MSRSGDFLPLITLSILVAIAIIQTLVYRRGQKKLTAKAHVASWPANSDEQLAKAA